MQVSKEQNGQIKNTLKVKLNSKENPFPASEIAPKLLQPRRLSSYFIVLIESGNITYKLDDQEITITDGDLLFAMPNQFFVPPPHSEDLTYYKVIFDETTLALLPKTYSFLVNPLNSQTICLDASTRARVTTVFSILNQLLSSEPNNSEPEIILAYLHLLLSELNTAYFKNETNTSFSSNLSKFVEFKLIVETHLQEQPSIHTIAEKLAISTNSLYRLVKEYSGSSPKDFFTNRLMLEAQRKLRYSNLSVKELAYELGFNDPDYFSRLFKKSTGKSISEFLSTQDLSGK